MGLEMEGIDLVFVRDELWMEGLVGDERESECCTTIDTQCFVEIPFGPLGWLPALFGFWDGGVLTSFLRTLKAALVSCLGGNLL